MTEPRRAGNFSATTLEVPGPVLLTTRRYADARGHFAETYSLRDLAALGVEAPFVQDNQSLSRERGTIRGLHHQAAPRMQGKLVRVLRGSILDVAVDIRRASPHFGRHVAVTLDAAAGTILYVPPGFAHGFCTLEDETEVTYKVTEFYDAALDRAIAWNDPQVGVAWPVGAADARLSDKDRAAPPLAQAPDLPP